MKIIEEAKILEVPMHASDEYGMAVMTSRLGSGTPTQVEVAVVRLRPDDGRFLTQSGVVELAARVVTGGEILLGKDDCAGNWMEIDSAEAEAILAEQAREAEAQEADALLEIGNIYC